MKTTPSKMLPFVIFPWVIKNSPPFLLQRPGQKLVQRSISERLATIVRDRCLAGKRMRTNEASVSLNSRRSFLFHCLVRSCLRGPHLFHKQEEEDMWQRVNFSPDVQSSVENKASSKQSR